MAPEHRGRHVDRVRYAIPVCRDGAANVHRHDVSGASDADTMAIQDWRYQNERCRLHDGAAQSEYRSIIMVTNTDRDRPGSLNFYGSILGAGGTRNAFRDWHGPQRNA